VPNVFPFNQVNDLPEDSFIAGTHKIYTFDILDETGNAVNLASCQSLNWELARLGSVVAVISASATYSGTPNNQMSVEVLTSKTLNLSGKYVHQPVIVDASGNEFRPSQGIITIFARIS
jgi:hypothetical protein